MLPLIILTILVVLIDTTGIFKSVEKVESILYEEYETPSKEDATQPDSTEPNTPPSNEEEENVNKTKQKIKSNSASDAAELLRRIKEGD